MSPQSMWSLLCNNNIVSIPMLFDICSIYGQSYKKELNIIFKELFTCQKLYKENLKTFIQLTIKVSYIRYLIKFNICIKRFK